MTDALQLRSVVESSLETYLGTYKFTNGQTIPAIAIVANNGEIYPPEGTKVEGMEVIIFLPALAPTPLLTGHKVKEEWVIHLKQWTKGKGVQDALRSFLAADLDNFIVGQINQVPASVQLGIPGGAQIKLSKYSILGN